jgi:ABC-2 type transport system ATP-binding protein
MPESPVTEVGAERPGVAAPPSPSPAAPEPAVPTAPTGASPAVAPPVVELAGLTVQLGGRTVLDGLSAALRGRAIGLLGPNGAGKTTLLHTLLGFHRPAAGTARVFGHDVGTERREIRQLLGYMPENDAFVAGMSGVRFVRLMAELSGLPAEAALERAHEALFYVGLGEARYRPIGTYSLGMRQLAKLAQALVHGPRLLFLDEPTNGLDPPARVRMLELVRDLRDAGEVAVILSSHLLRDVEQCCDEVVVLKAGRIAVTADLAAERASNRRFLELEIRGAAEPAGTPPATPSETPEAAFAAAAERLGCEVAWSGRQRLKLVLPEAVDVADLYRLAAEGEVQIRRLAFERTSLEDIFLGAMDDRKREVPHGGL